MIEISVTAPDSSFAVRVARKSLKTQRIDAVTADRPKSPISRSASGQRNRRSTDGSAAREAIQEHLVYFEPTVRKVTRNLAGGFDEAKIEISWLTRLA